MLIYAPSFCLHTALNARAAGSGPPSFCLSTILKKTEHVTDEQIKGVAGSLPTED